MQDQAEVQTQIAASAAAAFEGAPVLFAYLYGSQATGRARPDSDVDIAVYAAPDVPPERYLELRLRLPTPFQQVLRAEVEVVVLNEAPLALRGRVLREGVVIYARDESARVRFERLARNRFFDFQIHSVPLAERMLRDTARERR